MSDLDKRVVEEEGIVLEIIGTGPRFEFEQILKLLKKANDLGLEGRRLIKIESIGKPRDYKLGTFIYRFITEQTALAAAAKGTEEV
ncbi:MAG TPA: hypothetical protein VL754_09755 [Verrucomicrobiae bacterium]|jgi:hypothetical protein|nr:hypothetical protein [Verrucomicrobiae bacterium]